MNKTHFREAAILRATYCQVLISLHHPFHRATAISKAVPTLSLSSLATCTSAARAGSHIIEACIDLRPRLELASVGFNSGLVLMISVLEARRSGLDVDVATYLADVETCLDYLKKFERR